MARGKVKWFNDAKGYGFIFQEEGREFVVHYSSTAGAGFRSRNRGADVEDDDLEAPHGERLPPERGQGAAQEQLRAGVGRNDDAESHDAPSEQMPLAFLRCRTG